MNIVTDKYNSNFRDISPIRLANTNISKNYTFTSPSVARCHSLKKKAAAAFLKSNIPYVNQKAQQMMMCGLHPQHMRGADGKITGYQNIRCHSHFCIHCASIDETINSIQWNQALNDFAKQVGKVYPYFVTLTVRNCAVADIRPTLKAMNEAHKKLQDRKFFRQEVKGWMKGLEITHSKQAGMDTHPHFHLLWFSTRPLEEAFPEYVDETDENPPTTLLEFIFGQWKDVLGSNIVVDIKGQDLQALPAVTMKIDHEIRANLGIGWLAKGECGAGTGVTDELREALFRSGKMEKWMEKAIFDEIPFEPEWLEELKILEEKDFEKRKEAETKVKYIVKYITKLDDITQHSEWAAQLMNNTIKSNFHGISQNLKKLIQEHKRPELTKECLLLSGRVIRLKRGRTKGHDAIVTNNNAVFTLDCEETKQQKETGQSLHQAIKNGCLRFMLEQANFDPDGWLNIIDYTFASLHALPEAGHMSRHILQEWMDSTVYCDARMADELWTMIENMAQMMRETGLMPWQMVGMPHPEINIGAKDKNDENDFWKSEYIGLTEDQMDGMDWIRQSYDAIQRQYTKERMKGYISKDLNDVLNQTKQFDAQIANINNELLMVELGEIEITKEKMDDLLKSKKSLTLKRNANIQSLTGMTREHSKERFEKVAEVHQEKYTVIKPADEAMLARIELRIAEIEEELKPIIKLNRKFHGHISNENKEILKAGRARKRKLRKYLREHSSLKAMGELANYTLEILPEKEEPILASLSHAIPFPFLPNDGKKRHDFSLCFGEEFTNKATEQAEAQAELDAYKAQKQAQKWTTVGYGYNKSLEALDDIKPKGGLVPTTCQPSTAELRFSGLKDNLTWETLALALFDEQAIKGKVIGKRQAIWDEKQAKRIAKGLRPEEAPQFIHEPSKMACSIFEWTPEQAIIKNAQRQLKKQAYKVAVMRVDSAYDASWSHQKGAGSNFKAWRQDKGQVFNAQWYASHAIEVVCLVEIDGQVSTQKFHAPATQMEAWKAMMGKAITRKPLLTLKQCMEDPDPFNK